jgi:murein DD-endopeptidase MepM/ murein hydrolase activator NlpD
MRRGWLAAAVAIVGAAALFAASGRWPWRRLPAPVQPGVAVRPVVAVPVHETLDTLERGENAVRPPDPQRRQRPRLLPPDPSASLDPRRVRPGPRSARRPDTATAPNEISVRTSPERRLVFQRSGDQWNTVVEPIAWKAETMRIAGGIDNSLHEALDAQVGDDQLDGADRQRLAWDLADVYAWEVDFTRDIQPGDRFQVVFERLVSQDGEVRFGRVLAADLTMSGKSLTAFRFDDGGHSAFYDTNGNSLRRAFLRAPVQFRRISSSFARARFHRVLGLTRRHEGTDYAAAPGTPVMAAGDGVVLRAGRAGGYGNLIELRHRNGITTRYGHLRGFARGIHAGARVEQGQMIGYVGSTGLATGPHLHYEFRINGVARDSRRVDLGNGAPIGDALRTDFQTERDRLLVLLHPEAPASVAAAPGEPPETPARWLP